MPDVISDLLVALHELWWDEYAKIETEWVDVSKLWEVRLLFATDRDVPHGADWVEYTWIFPDDTLALALVQAVEWCRELAAFRRCGDCDGVGWYWAADKTKAACEACEGTGVAKEGP